MNLKMRPLATGHRMRASAEGQGWLLPFAGALVPPLENGRASGHGAMTFVPLGVPHGVLSGLLLPLRTLGAVKRDVFFDDRKEFTVICAM